MTGFLRYAAEIGWWIAAIFVAAAPTPLWPRLEPPFPIRSAAPVAGILTFAIGFAIGVRGFFEFATRQAVANNDWMLRQLSMPNADPSSAMVPYGMSLLTLFIFLFFTPTGLLALYLITSGSLRGLAAWFDDPQGDPLLAGAFWAAATLFAKNLKTRARMARERLEGPEAPDVLRPGAWAGLNVDYVVLAARRKPEWDSGAMILTSADWYRLGVPFDIETPSGLRTAYPLTKMETVEVVRRGIQYELPKAKGKT